MYKFIMKKNIYRKSISSEWKIIYEREKVLANDKLYNTFFHVQQAHATKRMVQYFLNPKRVKKV